MKRNRSVRLGTVALGLMAFGLLTASALAAEKVYNLEANVTAITMPGGVDIVMWQFFDADGDPGAANPRLIVPPGDSLRINLKNNLPEPASIMIPGQAMPLDGASATPQVVRNTDGRIRSFVHETGPGETMAYVWSGVRPGTYLYETGTHPAVQVQMGLYGAITIDAAPGEAYPSQAYDRDVVLLYSEIDPALHAAVADGTYGTAAYPSTIHYEPKYFLINGLPYSEPAGAPPTATAGERVLLRFLNAGLKTHSPTLLNAYVSVIAEDGNLYPYAKEQYSVFLSAGKTQDAVFVPAVAHRYAIYDHSGGLGNPGLVPGGMIAYVEATAP